jgi:hypothetical protein
MGGAPALIAAKKNGTTKVFEMWTYEHVDITPGMLAARNFENVAEGRFSKIVAKLIKLRGGEELSGLLEEGCEEWLHIPGEIGHGDSLIEHGAGGIVEDHEILEAGLLLDADENVVDVFRPFVARSEQYPGPTGAERSTALDHLRDRDGDPVYVHVLRVRLDKLRAWGNALTDVLESPREHGPDNDTCWEHALLVQSDASVIDRPHRRHAFRDDRRKLLEMRRADLFGAIDAGDDAVIDALWKKNVGRRDDVIAHAITKKRADVAARLLADAGEPAVVAAIVSAARGNDVTLARALFGKLTKKKSFAALVVEGEPTQVLWIAEQLVALKMSKKIPVAAILDRAWRWRVADLDALARLMPEAQPVADKERARVAEVARANALTDRMFAAIDAGDVDALRGALDDGADLGGSRVHVHDAYPLAEAINAVHLGVDVTVAIIDVLAARGACDDEKSLPRAIERAATSADDLPILAALLRIARLRSKATQRLLRYHGDEAVSMYRLFRSAGWSPEGPFLGNFLSAGPLPPLVHAVIAEFPERADDVADALKLDALFAALGDVKWSMLGTTLSLWRGNLIAWVIDGRVFVKTNDEGRAVLAAQGGGEPHASRDDFVSAAPDALSSPEKLRAALSVAV